MGWHFDLRCRYDGDCAAHVLGWCGLLSLTAQYVTALVPVARRVQTIMGEDPINPIVRVPCGVRPVRLT
jgi:hypothetical protein